MPYVEGPSLEHRIAEAAPLAVEETLSIAREVAEALDYAHRNGVVHRDVKPGNVLLSDGHAVVADFGIAQLTREHSRLTDGSIIGTLTYMSPEQLSGGEVDHRTDIYSLTCVVYEMLAGRPPFSGSLHEVLAFHLDGTPKPLTTLRSNLHRAVDTCIARGLAKVPAERYASAGRLVEELQDAVG